MVLDNNCSRYEQNNKHRAVHSGVLSLDLTHSPRAQSIRCVAGQISVEAITNRSVGSDGDENGACVEEEC